LEEEFRISEVLRKELNLKEHYSTICKAVKMREEDLKRLLEESAKLLDVKLDIMAIDWIERGSSYYYTKIRKKRKNWTKMKLLMWNHR